MESAEIFKVLTAFAGAVMLAGIAALKFLWAENKALTKQITEQASLFEPVLKGMQAETEAISRITSDEHGKTRALVEAQVSRVMTALEAHKFDAQQELGK